MGNEPDAKNKQPQNEPQNRLEISSLTTETPVSRAQHFVHFCRMVGKNFIRNRCPVRASALAYTTLLAIIPMLAVILSVSASLLKEKGVEPINQMIDTAVGKVAFQLDMMPEEGESPTALKLSAEVVTDGTVSTNKAAPLNAGTRKKTHEVAERIHEYIKNVRTGTLGATATIALIFVGISLLSTIEVAFNDIWGVTRGRSWVSRVTHYWAVMTLGPLLLVVVLGLKSMTLLGKIPAMGDTLHFLQTAPFISALLEDLLPFAVLSITFSLFYELMPNTKVQWKAAFVGGLVAAALWQLNGHLNFIYVSQVARSSQIYGGLGAVPVILMGLYFSWMIVLFGAQISYAIQNRKSYLQQQQADSVNQRGREFIALRVMTYIAQKFKQGTPPATLTEISEKLTVPSQLVAKVITPLQTTNLLAEVHGLEAAYIPARPLESISYQNILDAMRSGQGNELATKEDPTRNKVREQFENIRHAEEETASKITLASLV